MKIKIEFSESKSKSYEWTLRLCKKIKTYHESVEDGMTVHSIELDFKKDWQTFEVLAQRLGAWKNTAFYLDGALISHWQIQSWRYRQIEDADLEAQRRREYGIPAGGRIEINPEHMEGEAS